MTSGRTSAASKRVVLVRILAIDLVLGVVFIAAWYLVFLRHNRRRAIDVLRWIERAFAGHGTVAGVQWLAASRFRVRLKIPSGVFRHAVLVVQLMPREMPVNWLLTRIRRQRETLTFEADLDYPPTFSLEVHNHRWVGKTAKRFPKRTQNWETEYAGPFVLTTRTNWQREITTMMNSLVASRDCDCMRVRIRRDSPHFTATVPLAAISPGSEAQSEIFDIFRELAMGASTSRF